MPFARQTSMLQRVPDLARFVGTPRQAKDPCFHCTLWDCDQTSPECPFVNTAFNAETRLGRERLELLEELKESGIVADIARNGVVLYATDEAPEERVRRQKREHMRRVRAGK